MAKVKIQGNASGTGVLTVTAPNTSTDRTITLPDATATIATTTDVAARLPSITDGGNATAMTIDSSENVGFGTSSPATAIHVNGGTDNIVATFESTDSDALIEIKDNGTSDTILFGASGDDFLFRCDAGSFTYKVNNNATTAMTIDSTGAVTMPLQPAFFAYEGASQNSDTIYTVEFTTAATNVGSHYNTSTYRFTAPVAGTYFFSYGWMISTESNRSHITKNGTVVGENQYSPSLTYSRHEASAVITCAVNDYIEVKNNVGNHATESAMHGSYRYFAGHLIG